ncbi:efflux RND transporter periplasmic adaptor subunit [Psychromonas sp. MME2]|uniref:efflux RND transporter periplasmic adaptor subunit n=1 Tax=unclassified Psychromonas TaxID=2614957 RepID=UPI00339C2104
MNKKLFALSCVLFSLVITPFSVAKQAAPAPRAVPVKTEVVGLQERAQSISLIGKLQSQHFVNLAFEVSGKISAIHVKANQQVKAGQLLVQLDDQTAQTELLEAQAYLADEKRKLAEFSKLLLKNATSRTQVDAQSALVEIAAARLQAAKVHLDLHYLRAPFSGTLGFIDFSLGKLVNVGESLLTLDDLSVMDLDLHIPERHLSQLRIGMPVSATTYAWPDNRFIGEIKAIDSRINSDTLNLRVRVQFANQQLQLKPGLMMSAKVNFPAVEQAIIPIQALEYSGSKRFVYVIDKESRVTRQEVILGARINDSVLIEKGVNVGDVVVVQGLVNMRDGLLIKDLGDPKDNREVH